LSSQILEDHYIPYSVAKKLLLQVSEAEPNPSNLLQRTISYLSHVEKCEAEEAETLMRELEEIIEREDLRAMIASICPLSLDEVRSILGIDSAKTYSTEEVEKIVESVKKHLKS